MRRLAVAALIACVATAAWAHSWYDEWCCNNQDCAPAEVTHHDDGSITARTIHGTATFPPNFKRRPSQDGRYHACILKWSKIGQEGRCLYVPAGT